MYDIDTENRFWSKILTGDINECWVCVATSIDNGGYGHFYANGDDIYAHRFSFQLFHNRLIQDGLFILHSCDNPSCVNPHHLKEGTQQENVTDRENKGRGNQPKGENQYLAILKEFQVKEIRAKYEKGQITQKQLANDYGVNYNTIFNIINRRSWKHI